MFKIRSLFVCGIILIVLPILGFPMLWDRVISVILGVIVCLTVYFLHRELKIWSQKISPKKEVVTNTYVENRLGV
jgi:hypothetical protein